MNDETNKPRFRVDPHYPHMINDTAHRFRSLQINKEYSEEYCQMLNSAAELQAEVERLKSASREVADHSLAMSSQNETLREQLDQLKSWEASINHTLEAASKVLTHYAALNPRQWAGFNPDHPDGWVDPNGVHAALDLVNGVIDRIPAPTTEKQCFYCRDAIGVGKCDRPDTCPFGMQLSAQNEGSHE